MLLVTWYLHTCRPGVTNGYWEGLCFRALAWVKTIVPAQRYALGVFFDAWIKIESPMNALLWGT